MNDQINQANAVISWLEALYAQHPITFLIGVAILTSWVTTLTFKTFLHATWKHRNKTIRAFDVVVSGYVAARLWPYAHKDIVFLLVGGLSPVVYFAVSEAACWKWPSLRPKLSLKELTTTEEIPVCPKPPDAPAA